MGLLHPQHKEKEYIEMWDTIPNHFCHKKPLIDFLLNYYLRIGNCSRHDHFILSEHISWERPSSQPLPKLLNIKSCFPLYFCSHNLHKKWVENINLTKVNSCRVLDVKKQQIDKYLFIKYFYRPTLYIKHLIFSVLGLLEIFDFDCWSDQCHPRQTHEISNSGNG